MRPKPPPPFYALVEDALHTVEDMANNQYPIYMSQTNPERNKHNFVLKDGDYHGENVEVYDKRIILKYDGATNQWSFWDQQVFQTFMAMQNKLYTAAVIILYPIGADCSHMCCLFRRVDTPNHLYFIDPNGLFSYPNWPDFQNVFNRFFQGTALELISEIRAPLALREHLKTQSQNSGLCAGWAIFIMQTLRVMLDHVDCPKHHEHPLVPQFYNAIWNYVNASHVRTNQIAVYNLISKIVTQYAACQRRNIVGFNPTNLPVKGQPDRRSQYAPTRSQYETPVIFPAGKKQRLTST